jgi:hypothetical protein
MRDDGNGMGSVVKSVSSARAREREKDGAKSLAAERNGSPVPSGLGSRRTSSSQTLVQAKKERNKFARKPRRGKQ